ncbi:inositol monophosphatase family protein [Uliginosibacterium gangwonense]|uniref:inositol monophosphatase family protein n=1 Tax=Uliginosibacterium gangwonense TaxID=392736 RepID=UPI0003A8ACEE|nr:inositol monophosphatase [Uliginosibacterium gangwonense]
MPLLARARALESIIRDVARDAIMPYFLNAVREHKTDGSSLTQADLASQQALLEKLPELEEAPILSEEMSTQEQLACWETGGQGIWCIDPIDGTTNFANGVPLFAVSVAYMVEGETQYGVIYNPTTDEAFYAARGCGAWLNGRRLPLRPSSPQLRLSVAGIDFKRISDRLATELITRPPYYSQRNFGSSALEWCFVAAGRLDIYLHGGQALWDYAAGRLILEEAGGAYGVLDGGPLVAAPLPKRAVVLASNPVLYAEWLAWLQSHR